MTFTTKEISLAVIGLMVGLVVGATWHFNEFLPLLPTQPTAVSASTTNTLPPESGTVTVSDQKAGSTALIDSVTVPPPGVWVAVQDVNADGTLGSVLGASRVRHPATNVTVDLLRPTVAGTQYAVVLYRDDNNGVFARATDSRYVDFDTGSPVEELFKAE